MVKIPKIHKDKKGKPYFKIAGKKVFLNNLNKREATKYYNVLLKMQAKRQVKKHRKPTKQRKPPMKTKDINKTAGADGKFFEDLSKQQLLQLIQNRGQMSWASQGPPQPKIQDHRDADLKQALQEQKIDNRLREVEAIPEELQNLQDELQNQAINLERANAIVNALRNTRQAPAKVAPAPAKVAPAPAPIVPPPIPARPARPASPAPLRPRSPPSASDPLLFSTPVRSPAPADSLLRSHVRIVPAFDPTRVPAPAPAPAITHVPIVFNSARVYTPPEPAPAPAPVIAPAPANVPPAPIVPSGAPAGQDADDEKEKKKFARRNQKIQLRVADLRAKLKEEEMQKIRDEAKLAKTTAQRKKINGKYASINKIVEKQMDAEIRKIIKEVAGDKAGVFNIYSPDMYKQMEGFVGLGKPQEQAPTAKGGLYDDQLNQIMSKYPDYLGTVAVDEIKTLLPYIKPQSRIAFIFNTDKASGAGVHWIALFADARPEGSNSIEYMDSFAREPSPAVLKDIQLISQMLQSPNYLKLKVNKVVQQFDDTETCGWHCAQFLIDRFRGKSFAEATGYNPDQKIHGHEEHSENRVENMQKRFHYI